MKLRGVQYTSWKGIFAFIVIVIVFPFIFQDSFYITQATFAGIYAIVAIGLGLLLGYAGQISLGQAAFYGVGAYTTAILTTKYGLDPWLSLPISIILPALLAFIMGYTMSRLSGYYLAMATLAFGIIIYNLLMEMKTITNGASGLYGVPIIQLFGFQMTQGLPYYFFVWSFAIIVIIFSLNIVHSRFGRALRSIHASEVAATSMGVNTGKFKMHVFVLSAVYAGLAGWLFAHMSYSISPGSFSLNSSILFLIMVVLGGSTNIWGGVLGAILVKGINIIVHALGERFPFITSDFEHVIYGAILVVVVIFMPKGLFSVVANGLNSITRKKGPTAKTPTNFKMTKEV